MIETKEAVLKAIKKENVKFIDLQFTDIVGIVKSITIPVSQVAGALENGIWFDGSSIEGFARIAESDMYLMPVPSTFALIPWTSGEQLTARMICDVYTPEGAPFAGAPRHVLARMMGEAEELGYIFQTGPEPEFFLFEHNEDGTLLPLRPHDNAGYFDVPTDMASMIKRKMVTALSYFGIEVEAAHHEVAIGQHEIDFEYADALSTADSLVTLRIVVKAIAQLNGLYASFMPKPIAGINGSGMHTHMSFKDKKTGENAFANPDDEYGLSEIAKHFIAGILAHAPGLAAVVAPLVNSYKRLVPGYEAPVYISWARINRSALVRIPKANEADQARIELRCPDPSTNPYLAFAVMLAAGLDGIKRGLVPPPPTEENLYYVENARRSGLKTLPGSLRAALDELEKDDVIRAALGEHVYERFMDAKLKAWDEYRLQVTDWELERYLPIY